MRTVCSRVISPGGQDQTPGSVRLVGTADCLVRTPGGTACSTRIARLVGQLAQTGSLDWWDGLLCRFRSPGGG
jgi:hypothetical protein